MGNAPGGPTAAEHEPPPSLPPPKRAESLKRIGQLTPEAEDASPLDGIACSASSALAALLAPSAAEALGACSPGRGGSEGGACGSCCEAAEMELQALGGEWVCGATDAWSAEHIEGPMAPMFLNEHSLAGDVRQPWQVLDLLDFEAAAALGEVVTMPAVPSGLQQGSRTFEAKLARTGVNWRSLGLLLTLSDPKHLVVEDVWSPSLASDWNGGRGPKELQIRPGDVIRAVNGITVAPMMQHFVRNSGRGDTLILHVVRPAGKSW